MRGFLGIATAAIVSNLLCSSPSYSNQDYVIPDGLIPMSEWANGTSAKKAEQFRITYRARDFWAGTDNTVFAYLNLSEVLNTMIISRAGPIAPLEVEANEAVAGVVATTKLGTLSLREAIADPRLSFWTRAQTAVHAASRPSFDNFCLAISSGACLNSAFWSVAHEHDSPSSVEVI